MNRKGCAAGNLGKDNSVQKPSAFLKPSIWQGTLTNENLSRSLFNVEFKLKV
jgi:hypothetical protein